MAEMHELFRALGSPAREAMVEHLSVGPATASQLREVTGLSKAAVSQHLDVLETAGLVRRERVGRASVCTLQADPLGELADWLTDRWAYWTAANARADSARRRFS